MVATAEADVEPDLALGTRRRRLARWAAVAMAAVVLPVTFVFAERLGTNPRSVDSPLLGQVAPPFDLARFDGPGRVRSDSLLGRIVVVNFWASWCVPCRRENAQLDSFYRRWRSRGVELVGILYADDVDSAVAFRDELGGSWPLVQDPSGRTALDYGVAGVPETFVIDARGVVMAKLIGAVGPTTLDEVLARIGAGGPPVTAANDDYREAPSG